MAFRFSECAIPTVWCGKGARPARDPEKETRYKKVGSRTECMQKGFGAGKYTEIGKRLPNNSLERIKYVNGDHVQEFRDQDITTTTQLINFAQNHTTEELQTLLRDVFGHGNTLEKKPHNAVLMYLYRHGVGELPRCSRIR